MERPDREGSAVESKQDGKRTENMKKGIGKERTNGDREKCAECERYCERRIANKKAGGVV